MTHAMLQVPYVELHCHSGYSFLDGASHPEELVLTARALAYPALALTDHDGLYGSMEFAQFARSEGIQPITGAELTVSGILEGAGIARRERLGPEADRCHLTLLAETSLGYSNLCRLITRARMGSPRDDPHVPLEALLSRCQGLIVLTGCRAGALPRALEWGGVAGAEALALRLREALGELRKRFAEE